MDLGRGFSIPLEKGVSQNGNNWIPSTPDKPILQRSSNNAQSESPKNQTGEENWLDLVDLYGGVLRDKQTQKFDLNRTVGVNYREHNNQGVAPVETYRLQQDSSPTGIVGLNSWLLNGQDVAPVEAYKLPLNFSPTGCLGVNSMDNSIQDVSVLQRFGNLSQNAGRIGSYTQNSGEVVPPQKVSSLAELMGMRSALCDPPSNGSPNRSNYVNGKPTIICPIVRGENNPVGHTSAGAQFQQNHIFHGSSQLAYTMVGAKLHQSRAFHESNQVDYATVGAKIQQSHILHASHDDSRYNLQEMPMDYASAGAKIQQSLILHASHDDSRYNLQEMPNSRLSVPNYNLCVPPRSEAGKSSSGARPLPLGPVTPNQQSKTQQTFQEPHLLIDETSTQEKYTKDNAVSFPEPQHLERDHSDILPHSVGTSIAETSTSPKERNNSDGGNGGIDLNTTPQQKTPRRRKHRPKVVVEGKPKRSPKTAATKNNTPEGNPPMKRNYVRKNGAKNSTPPSTDTVKVVEASDLGPATKSCKRKLNFDLDNGAEKESKGRGLDYQEHNNEGCKLPLDLNLDFHNAECSTELNGPSTSVLKAGHQYTYGQQKQQRQTACSFVHSTNKILPQESMPLVTAVLPPTSVDHALNIIARNLNVQNASINQYTDDSKCNQVHHHTSGAHTQLVLQANINKPDLGFGTQSAVQTMPQVLEDLVNVNEKHGPEREYTHTMIRNPHTIALMGSQIWSRGVSKSGHCDRDSGSLWQNALGMHKNKNVEDNFRGTSSSMHSGITTVEDFQRRMNQSFPAESSTVHLNGELGNSDYRRQTIYSNPNNKSTKATCYMNYPDARHKFQQQHVSSQMDLYSARMASMSSHDSVNMQITRNLAAGTNWNLESASHGDPKLDPIDKNIYSPLCIAVKRQSAGQTTSKKVPVVDKILQKESKNKRSYGHSSKKGVQEERRNLCSIDYITKCMKDLQITEEHSALVPYRGDGAVVPYEEFRVKKKQPRPRVDLDPETNRLWNLLMGKQGDESTETMDTGREKWWEEERKVFRGRVDSFIARMHLVQGDRRFSKWKGSVVDSVIGVFLTQNVSDHLSSSAFMSLAAKFPVRSTSVRQSCCKNGVSPSGEHHEVRITYPDGTTFHHKMVKEPVYGHSSVISTDTSEDTAENVMPEKGTFLMNDHTRRTEEDIISSQSSSESFVLQASEDIRSSSGSNSETEGGWNLSRNLEHISVSEQAERIAALQQNQFGGSSNSNQKPLIGHQHLEKAAYRQNPGQAGISTTKPHQIISKVQHYDSSALQSSNSWLNMSMVMQNLEADAIASLGKEGTSTLASKDSDITNVTGAEYMHEYIGQSAESAFTGTHDGRTKFQPSSVNHAVLDKCFGLKTDSLDESHNKNGQHFIKHMSEKQEALHQESTFLIDPSRPAQAYSKQQDKSKHMEVGTEMMRLGQSSDEPSSKISTTTSNARKRKAEKEKTEPFNWDILRKQVQSKTGTRERSRDAMDSLDYDALLKADVREISDTIKERGMNNMLAERMKDFLNRLVQDHEKVDLEWLRDVEPDKAKDYLLSIRGIGLKSVECVRLLTLHHLAFPVDTNVGRIAVRLGWVPLQPLPESLQLHLLELYPVLESIQKYLWPRLCKLDQETLYELHYQMITFGKVFCTKREPNCNACPMRGECRHFASAFASARLALPGPQERHIVSSTAPISANKSPDVIIKPMLLPSSEDNIGLGKGLTRDCEPLIEEPTTPESPTEVAERDIEDALYEDPDEIPVIKLDVEEFTTNLQSFMQEQMEMGVGDMSKALVALSPELASLPIPKLKNISRLRTEHQVYQLPDSHPLLKGMDRREPDDPSPYLLAIWTPGETADSIQPPQSNCSSMEGGGLCNNTTCFSCNSTREAQAQTVRGTILIPCRTAMRGSFPLNGTYFQVNEVFADHESSLNPIDVPRNYLWNLPRRTVFFGTSVTSIFKGLSTEGIQYCFWKGFVCVRGFDQKTRAPRPLKARLHFPASKMAKQNQ